METQEYIESGILELYVLGLLTESENREILGHHKKHREIYDEIVSIEKSIIDLSSGFSPYLSSSHFINIREKLQLKHSTVVEMQPRSNAMTYLGWAAAVLLLLGVGYQYSLLNKTHDQFAAMKSQRDNLEKSLAMTEQSRDKTMHLLEIIRDENSTVVPLAGQAVDPQAHARVYWNKRAQTVYIDAQGLPEAPEGMVYQVWALKLNPLTPTSIGLLDLSVANNYKIFKVDNNQSAEGFGITLEPAGGSPTPTMEKLYTLGKV